jgi:hypothetical protein
MSTFPGQTEKNAIERAAPIVRANARSGSVRFED